MNSKATGKPTSIMLAAVISTIATEIIMMVFLFRQYSVSDLGINASLIYTLSLVGTGAAGIIGASILRRYTNVAIGIYTSVFCATIVVLAIHLRSTFFTFTFAGLMAFVTALDNPNINTTLNRHITARERPSTFSMYHLVLNSAVVSGPLLGAAMIHNFGVRSALLVSLTLYLLSSLPWLYVPSHRPEEKTQNMLSDIMDGYGTIVSSPGLRNLTISRLLNNLIYTALPVIIPLIAANLLKSSASYVWFQSIALAALRSGALGSSLFATTFLKRHPELAIKAAQGATIIGVISLVGISLCFSPFLLLAFFFSGGIGQFFFRLSGLVLGPSVTPINKMSEIILASDTIVRFYSGFYSYSLIYMVGYFGSLEKPLIFAAILALPAPLFLKNAISAYKYQLLLSHKEI